MMGPPALVQHPLHGCKLLPRPCHDGLAALLKVVCLLLQGVTAVLSGGIIDVLCHAAVRARNTGVLLAACREPQLLQELRALEGQLVTVEAVSI